MTAPFMHNFRSSSNKFPTISELNFSHFTPQGRPFFVEKKGKKNFGFESAMERGIIKNPHCRKPLKLHLNFLENITEALVTSKGLKLP